MIGNVTEWISKNILGGSPTEVGFVKWVVTFTCIFVTIKFLMDNKDD